MIYVKYHGDSTRIRHLYPDVVNWDNEESALYINPKNYVEKTLFDGLFADLMNKYRIDEEFWNDIRYINQRFIKDLDNLIEIESISLETSEVISFFKDYQDLVEKEKAKRSRETDPFVLEVRMKDSQQKAMLNIRKSTPYLMQVIYRSVKSALGISELNAMLESYPEIPPASILNDMLKDPNIKIKAMQLILLKQTAKILSQYIKAFLPRDVYSRKVNRIIYELFYLFNIIQYAGNTGGVDCSKLIRSDFSKYKLPHKSNSPKIIKALFNKPLPQSKG